MILVSDKTCGTCKFSVRLSWQDDHGHPDEFKSCGAICFQGPNMTQEFYKNNAPFIGMDPGELIVPPDFGCNKWEAKSHE